MAQHSPINPPLVVAGITLPHAAILAPMSGVTDLPLGVPYGAVGRVGRDRNGGQCGRAATGAR